MISLSKVTSNIIEKGFRILKVIQFGAKTADSVAPFGDDSAPLKDMIAIYASTSEVGDNVILGYINKNQIAKEGEKRIFSLDSEGNLSTDIHLKTDGTIEIGGNSNTVTRYNPLNLELQKQVVSLNAELTKIAGVLNTLAPNSYVLTPITLDITGANSENIKIN